MATGLRHMTYKDRLRDMGLFRLEKTRQRGNLIAIHSSLMGIYRFGRAKLFSELHIKRTQEHGKFLLDLKGGINVSHH